MRNMRASTNFFAIPIIIITHSIYFYHIWIFFTKSTKRTVAKSFVFVHLFTIQWQVFCYHFIYHIFNLFNLLWCHFFAMRKIKPHTFCRNVAAALHYVLTQYIA